MSAIRSSGVRVSHGSWVVFVAHSDGSVGRLIVALGRKAGGAVTRSRIRRIARDLVRPLRDAIARLDILLLARDNVALEPRRAIRRTLRTLIERGGHALTRRQPSRMDVGG